MQKPATFLLVVFLSILTNKLSLQCPENERKALLSLKREVRDASNRLSSWVGKDCCKWQGIGCNNHTGHVVKLDLRNPFPFNEEAVTHLNPNDFSYEADAYERACLKVHKVNPSILELKHLNYLDLSWNNFSGITIPDFFGSFQALTYLNLSSSWFGGPVPRHLGNLSLLRHLDLSTPYLLSGNFEDIPQMNMDSFHWTSNLSSLQHLELGGIDLSKILEDSSLVLPSLVELRLYDCKLRNIQFLSHGNLPSLVTLNLRNNDLQGPIPKEIRNMTMLKVLDLSYNKFSSNGSIADELEELKNLEILHLSDNDFERKSIEHSVNILSPLIGDSLKALYMSNNHLNGSLPNWLYQLRNLEILDLSRNSFHGSIPKTFGMFRNLKELDISGNKLHGSFPTSLGKISTLEILRLEQNELNGSIPRSLGRLSNLTILDLHENQLSGKIPMSLGRLSNLAVLSLGVNQLSGQIPMSFKRLSNLEKLDLGRNQLSGHLPDSLGQLSRLTELDLSSNQLNETIPKSLGQLSELTLLDLSSNSLKGVLSGVHFAKLYKLQSLDLSMNSISLKIRPGWVPPFQLQSIDLASCEVGPKFPQWLRTQAGFNSLNLSNAGISDSIPSWFENISSQISYIDLSGNKIHGKVPNLIKSSILPMQIYLGFNLLEGSLPQLPRNLAILDLSNNKINGPIPKNIGDMSPELSFLGLSNNRVNGSVPNSLCKMQSLSYLDLSKNHLSGAIPRCWNNLQILEVIDLTSNNLSGIIPSSISQLPFLRSLYLGNNLFHGEISLALRNCTELSILDLGNNSLSGRIPTWIGEDLQSLKILRLRSNRFAGRISGNMCLLNNLQILDVASNNLSGTIPRCFGDFSAMVFNQTNGLKGSNVNSLYTDKLTQVIKGRELEYFKILSLVINLDLSNNNFVGHIPEELTGLSGLIGLNLSENHLTGNIPKKIGQMRSLQSLDFAANHLSGRIPQSLSLLSRLSHLNLSYNDLSGPIPTGNQLQTLEDPTIYKGNNDLCGPPVEKKCIVDDSPQSPTYLDRKGEDGEEQTKKWFYIGMASGIMVGFWGVCGILLLKKSWRYAYFRFMDGIKEKLFVMVMVRIARLKKKLKFDETEE